MKNWHYTYMFSNGDGSRTYGWGIQKTFDDCFNFESFYVKNPSHVILSVNEISDKQFERLQKFIDNNKHE